MLETVIETHNSGVIRLRSSEAGTWIQIHLPFDRSTDEWIDASLYIGVDSKRDAAGSSLSLSEGESQIVLERMDSSSGVGILKIHGANANGPVYAEASLDKSAYDRILRHLSKLVHTDG